MTYKLATPQIGAPALDDISDTAKVPLGTIVRAIDETYGEGEFIYLKGIGSTVAGSIANYDDSFQTALNTTGLATPRPLAVAVAACVANKFGWYQIGGLAPTGKAAATSFAKGAALAAGSGLAIAIASGLIINGALVAAVASAKSGVTSVLVMLDRPHDPSDVS